MTEVQVCNCLMCLAFAPLDWCPLLFNVTVLAVTFLVYYIPRHSANAVIPGSIKIIHYPTRDLQGRLSLIEQKLLFSQLYTNYLNAEKIPAQW